MNTHSPLQIDCPECNEGRVERFEDRMDSRGEHYTRDWTEECEHCAGTGHVDAAEAIDADAVLGIGAATELPLSDHERAEVDHLVRLSRNDTPRVRAAAERQVRLYPQFYAGPVSR